MTVILNEGDAVDHAIAHLGAGEVAIVFAEDVPAVIERLRAHGAVYATDFLPTATAQPAA